MFIQASHNDMFYQPSGIYYKTIVEVNVYNIMLQRTSFKPAV